MRLIFCKPADIPLEAQEYLEKEALGVVDYKIELDYDYWTAGWLDITLVIGPI